LLPGSVYQFAGNGQAERHGLQASREEVQREI
jgi:hypothetical protein